MSETRGAFEARYGVLGDGNKDLLAIGGDIYAIDKLFLALGLDFEDIAPIDALVLEADTRFAVRYYDGEDRHIVAYEFGPDLRYLREMRVHIAEWIGDDEYFNFGWNVNCPVNF